MARRSGNWWSGYRGKSDYQPVEHQFGFDPWSEIGTGQGGQQLENTMWDRVQGNRPSVAELQMEEGLGRQTASAYSMANSMPQLSPGMAMRLAGRQAGDAMGRTNMQMGQLRAGEQAGAEQRLGGWMTQQAQMRVQQQLEEERMRAQQQGLTNQLMMQQDIANAGGMSTGGWADKFLRAGGQMGAAALMGR